jgi:protein ImuA
MSVAIVPAAKSPVTPAHGASAGDDSWGLAQELLRRSRKAAPPHDPRPTAVRPAPETLHPALWRAHQFGRAEACLPSGFAALDAQLPGGGWPRRALTELLLPHPGIGEIRLMAPSLAEVQRSGRLVMLFDPPAVLSGWALAQLGLDVEALLVIQTGSPPVSARGARPGVDSGINARVWALEQALRSGHVGAVLAWLPPCLGAARLRRLQLAAHAHDGPAFVLRELAVQHHPSAAPLRLMLRPAGVDCLGVQVLKRRGPPLERALRLPLPAVVPGDVNLGPDEDRAGHAASQRLSVATFVNLA